jgi:hypothetical protein
VAQDPVTPAPRRRVSVGAGDDEIEVEDAYGGRIPRRVVEAIRAAQDRYGWGDGWAVDGDQVTWPRRGPDVTPCFGRIKTGPRRGEPCTRWAGAGTEHAGVGRCRQHGGSSEAGRREGAWIVAHGFARALDVTPWEALLTAVRIAAGRVAWIESKLATASDDRQLEPPSNDTEAEAARDADHAGTNLNYWVRQAEVWHDRLARVSKLAIDAGVAERLVRQLELEAELMLRATSLTFDELGLDDDTRTRALGIMSRNLLALEAQEVEVDDERENGYERD